MASIPSLAATRTLPATNSRAFAAVSGLALVSGCDHPNPLASPESLTPMEFAASTTDLHSASVDDGVIGPVRSIATSTPSKPCDLAIANTSASGRPGANAQTLMDLYMFRSRPARAGLVLNRPAHRPQRRRRTSH